MTKKRNHEKTKKTKKRVLKKKFTKKRQNGLKVKCSPLAQLEMEAHNTEPYTCYNTKTLKKLRDLWNARHPDAQINVKTPKAIWNALDNRLKKTCNQETCWLKQQFVVDKKIKKQDALNPDHLLEQRFAPISPREWKKNPNEWLSSVDITNVMRQFETAYKCFDFIGPSPIDYDAKEVNGDCVWEELCHFNLSNQIQKGKKKIGIIFNTDPHYKSGSHWISLFINIKKNKIFFFDSAGDKAPPEVMRFVKKVQEQGEHLSPPLHFTFDQNHPIEHQKENTECGVYSLYFIVHMLQDKINSHYLKTHILKDKYIEGFRKVYFNDSNLVSDKDS